MHAGNIIDLHDSLNIPLKRYILGIKLANLVVRRVHVHIQTLIYNNPCCQNMDQYSQKVGKFVRTQTCLLEPTSVLNTCNLCHGVYIS